MRSKREKRYWLFKSEPSSYSIDDLLNDKKTVWTGVRNFQARNHMREMSTGDQILFYHSSCKEPGVYGTATIVTTSYTDPSQFDAKGEYFERRATQENPIWSAVDIAFLAKLDKPVLLSSIRLNNKLRNMKILEKGSRLSITSILKEDFLEVVDMVS
jgi:predicted RNA-binding protein with PUA-like domain